MTKKKNEVKDNISSLGKGVLDLFEGNVDMKLNETAADKDDNSVKVRKSKRSFMLTDTAVQRLNLLRLCSVDNDLSSIVENAINQYFEQNKSSIDQLIDVYNKVK